MMLSKALQAAAGNAGEATTYVDDVFSTWLYTGNGSTQTITNGIDLAGEGGLVWIKKRTQAENHILTDTVRGAGNTLCTNLTAANEYDITRLSAFTASGFSVGTSLRVNENGQTYASWTFRKAPKFFDVVTWTGDGTFSKQVLHSLESSPGFIITKRTDSSTFGEWAVWHRNDGTTPKTHFRLNGTNEATNGSNQHTSTYFKPAYVEDQNGVIANQSGATYVAYLFAHDAGGFGADGSENVISCGSFTANANTTVNLGFEPQWIMIKNANAAYNWGIFDVMRGWTADGNIANLKPNLSDAETQESAVIKPTATGFQWIPSVSGNTYIYIAIRRPMKPPSAGTEVFEPVTRNTTGANATVNAVITPVDLAISQDRNAVDGQGALWFDRLRGATKFLRNASTDPEFTQADTLTSFAVQNGYTLGADAGQYGINSSPPKPVVYWNLRRASGFFDVVCYTGTGVARTVAHNLTVAPELMIVKCRSTARAWPVYVAPIGNTNELRLNETSGSGSTSVWNSTTPTSSVFSLGTPSLGNFSGDTYVAYLFATYPGVSKVFSYTGNGSSQTINCGFTGGARFVMIKRTDSTGDWYVWDSARGMVAGNDPHLSLNTTAAEVTTDDSVDTAASGFIVNQVAATNVNVTSATYIGLAIA